MAVCSSSPPVITLLTDFGLRDAYVGTMKGVILRALPEARIVDLSHDVAPQDVRGAAFILESAYRYFPAGTVHVAIVDPGVGGPRRIVAAEAGQWIFLGPDNGVLSCAIGRAGLIRAVEVGEEAIRRAQLAALPEGEAESATFHGRDRFAPLAAAIAGGLDLKGLGPPTEAFMKLELPEPERSVDKTRGEVIYVDRFGNLITNLRPEHLPDGVPVFELAGKRIEGLSRYYAERKRGELLALVGSTGRIEIAVRDGSAAERLAAGIGAKVLVEAHR